MGKKTASKKVRPTNRKRPSKVRGATKHTADKPKGKVKIPRATGNPFRASSSYGVGYDILASHPEGMPRQQFVESLAKATGKTIRRAGFDASVVLSAKNSPTGPRHRSCRE